MDSATLKTFAAVAEQGSFSLAGERLHLTQPAISKRIATLEQELGARLFDRIGRHISLTEAGQALLPRAHVILQEMEDSRRLIGNLSSEVNGRLSIGSSHHIGLHRLPPVLRRFTPAFPEVKLDLQFMDSETACRAVQAGRLELAIVTLPLKPPEGLKSERIWRDPLDVVVGRKHALAGRHRISRQQLTRHPAILPSPGTFTRALLERNLAPRGQRLKAGMTANYLEIIRMLVGVGLGWSVLPRTMLNGELAVLDILDINLSRELGTVHHNARTLSNAARAMLETLTDPE
jgi:DNA-binding transcriptional LysR family regulator